MCAGAMEPSLLHSSGETQDGAIEGPGATAVDAIHSLSAALGGGDGSGQHSNLFVRGLPLAWNEPEITAVFSSYGQLSSLRLVRHSVTKHSLG